MVEMPGVEPGSEVKPTKTSTYLVYLMILQSLLNKQNSELPDN